MKILLTGGAGYIGSHVLLCCLARGYDVAVIDNFSNGSPSAIAAVEKLSGKRVSVHRGDVRDEQLLHKMFKEQTFDTVLHFAGLKAVGESVTQPLNYFDVNVGGSVTLARVMQEYGVFRLVFSSTAAVYGDCVEMPLSEALTLGQVANPYGRSKRMVEEVLQDLAATDPRWAIAILRYFNPVGAHESGLIGEDPNGEPANLVPYAMQVATGRRPVLSVFGKDYSTPDGTGVRDYIHVMDLAEGHLAAMDYLQTHSGYGVWNLGTGRGYSVLEVVAGLEAIIGRSLPTRIVDRRPGDNAQSWADPSRAAIDFGWRATRPLNAMLADHWRWQTQNPKGFQPSADDR